ncbi:SRPBCC family protein [Acinetobacter sp. AYS6]|uniref:SRPBCC family protein n=1 Tax=Acinetobacter sp. AYS6 TaxID=2983297 RepID=UPI0021D682BB|nr:SRPBCC family protein [Acinetobacter sp. AYS6]MCU7696954.1 SRPBCC family protein [Acinetobacter sp. AYS6]
MHTLTVTKIIKAPIEDVFEAFTDHEKLSQVFGVRSCVLTRHGNTEKNGLGAIRELDCGQIWLREEITVFNRPNRMEYRILSSRPQAKHEYGQVDFIEIPEGTKVTWTTRFGVQLPGPSKLIDSAFGVVFGISFRLVLRNVERRALAARR